MKNIKKSASSFWLYKARKNSDNEMPIYMQVSLDGKRVQLATGIFINEKHWDKKKQMINKKNISHETLNAKLESLKKSYTDAYVYYLKTEDDFTVESIKNRMLGQDISLKTILEIMRYHNEYVNKMVGKNYSPATLKRYKTTEMLVEEFMRKKLKLSDFPVSKLSNTFLLQFDEYLKTERSNNHNTALKYVKNLMTCVNYAVDNGLINKSPFTKYKTKFQRTFAPFLTEEELNKIESKVMDVERLEIIRQIFLFQCYTGLAYCDVKNLKSENIVVVNDKRWIFTKRMKTELPVHVPLTDKAEQILAAYPDGFSVPSNQKMNSYLKEIATLSGIAKNISTHVARRTFATYALTNGVSIESISFMLGHSNIRTTQIYAKIVPQKVLREMKEAQAMIDARKNNKGKEGQE
jgi:site-specific recombinase XerD